VAGEEGCGCGGTSGWWDGAGGTHQCQSICANSNEQRMMSGNLHQRLIEEATGG